MKKGQTVFLMYHELELSERLLCRSESGYVRYVLRQKSFQSQMDWLRVNGWRGLSVSEAFRHPVERSVALTFDDGSETDLISAAPLLKERGFCATFYVTAAWIGKPGYLSAGQVRELSSMGFEIGCHSMNHAYLDDQDRIGLQEQIGDAGSKIEEVIGKKVVHFSCPGGRYSTLALAVAKEAGYKSVATSEARMNSLSDGPFVVGRTAILRDLNLGGFEKICTGKSLRRMRMAESTRGVAKKLLGNALYDRYRSIILREK